MFVVVILLVGPPTTLLQEEPVAWLIPIIALVLGLRKSPWWQLFYVAAAGSVIGLVLLDPSVWLGEAHRSVIAFAVIFFAAVELSLAGYWLGRLVRYLSPVLV